MEWLRIGLPLLCSGVSATRRLRRGPALHLRLTVSRQVGRTLEAQAAVPASREEVLMRPDDSGDVRSESPLRVERHRHGTRAARRCNVLLPRWVTAPVASAIAASKFAAGEPDAARWELLAAYLERVEAASRVEGAAA